MELIFFLLPLPFPLLFSLFLFQEFYNALLILYRITPYLVPFLVLGRDLGLKPTYSEYLGAICVDSRPHIDSNLPPPPPFCVSVYSSETSVCRSRRLIRVSSSSSFSLPLPAFFFRVNNLLNKVTKQGRERCLFPGYNQVPLEAYKGVVKPSTLQAS